MHKAEAKESTACWMSPSGHHDDVVTGCSAPANSGLTVYVFEHCQHCGRKRVYAQEPTESDW